MKWLKLKFKMSLLFSVMALLTSVSIRAEVSEIDPYTIQGNMTKLAQEEATGQHSSGICYSKLKNLELAASDKAKTEELNQRRNQFLGVKAN